MAKKNRASGKSAPLAPESVIEGEVPVVGMREPCPCGSGKRYKACHGKEASKAVAAPNRPFEGFASECDIVAMRELVPSATATLKLAKGVGDGRNVTLATVLPMAYPALVRANGDILLGLQINTGSGDASRDLANALSRALDAPHGEPVGLERVTMDSPRAQDLIDVSTVLEVVVHDNFDFWMEADAELTDDVKASLERASQYANPTEKLTSIDAGYWTQMGEKEHLRWIMSTPENDLLNALARLHVAGADSIGPDTRLVGMFRAQGLIVPVWDLPLGRGAAAIEEPAAEFGVRLQEALAESKPLSDAERRARSGLTSRQVTLRDA
ncbi:MAG: DUF5926 family protein [Candidatus Nanopelagicales bacterium]